MSGSVVTVGTFDGVHLGHQAVLRRVSELGRERALEPVAYTFPIPPRLAGARGEADLLLPFDVKRILLLREVDRVEAASFEEVRALPAEGFVESVLIRRLDARLVVVGEGFRFGRGREGDLPLLCRLGQGWGLDVVAVPPVLVGGEPVSSTRIRSLLRAGDIEAASALLGRPPLLLGEVVSGDGIGRMLGFPTANLALGSSVLWPADGVYLAQVSWNGRASPGLLYLGTRPTLSGAARRCEVHLLDDPAGDLIGAVLEVQILSRIRIDRRFPSVEALREQMERDAGEARARLGRMEGRPARILG